MLQIFTLKTARFSNHWGKHKKKNKIFKCDLDWSWHGNIHFVNLREKAQF